MHMELALQVFPEARVPHVRLLVTEADIEILLELEGIREVDDDPLMLWELDAVRETERVPEGARETEGVLEGARETEAVLEGARETEGALEVVADREMDFDADGTFEGDGD